MNPMISCERNRAVSPYNRSLLESVTKQSNTHTLSDDLSVVSVTISHTHIRAGCAGRTPAKILRNINTSRVQAKRELPQNKIISRYKPKNTQIHK